MPLLTLGGFARRFLAPSNAARAILAIDVGANKCGVALCDFETLKFVELATIRRNPHLRGAGPGACGVTRREPRGARSAQNGPMLEDATADEPDPCRRVLRAEAANQSMIDQITRLATRHQAGGLVRPENLGLRRHGRESKGHERKE